MFDEPFANASALSAWRLSQLASEWMTVALVGDGADEVLAGCRRQVLHHHQERLRASLPDGFRRGVLGALGRAYPPADWVPGPLHAKAALQALAGSGAESYALTLEAVLPGPRTALFGPELARDLGSYRAEQALVSLIEAAPVRSGLDQAQYADLMFRLPGDILTRLDRTSMAVGLEMCAPLLDHRLVEFAANLPERVRARGRHGKWLLRKAMRRYLPDEILCRSDRLLVPPIAAWLRGPLAGEAQAIAASAPLARTGWFDIGQVSRLAEAHRSGRADHSRLLWQLLMLDRSLVRLGLIS